MRRREVFPLLIAAAGWPFGARAQQPEQTRRIGVLMGYAQDDPIVQSGLAAFLQQLSETGWLPGRNLNVEYRWSGGDVERAALAANELVALKPDLIFASTTPVTAALKHATATIPIVFVQVSDPVGSGFIASLARPGANMTGFINMEDAMGGKWLELLREAAPNVTHATIIFNPETAAGAGRYFLPSFETAARSLSIAGSAAPVHNASEIERAIGDLGAQPNGGLVVMSDGFLLVHFELIRRLAETYRIPAVYGLSARAREGALISYAPDTQDLYRKSATYVDRILRGDDPRFLPVQLPTKFDLAINLRTAKALGLTIPQTLLAIADEVIE